MAHSSSSELPRSTSDTEAQAEPADPRTHVLPGPYSWDVLRRYTQRTHVSQLVWNEEKCRQCKTRRGKMQGGHLLMLFLTLWQTTCSRLASYMSHACDIFSALVERWRPETHTFHMTQSEMTITLQDVAAILGLPTEGRVVTGVTSTDWRVLCQEVLGHALLGSEQPYGDVKLSYLDRHYAHWGAIVADPHQVIFFTKAHIARVLGPWLLCDKSGGSVVGCRYIALLAGDFGEIGQYSWGSVVLAHLFRQLCELTDPRKSDMSGCHILLHIWARTRFPPIAPPLPQPTHPDWHYGHRFNGLARFKPQHQLLYRGTLDTLCRHELSTANQIDA
ncbi:serine/threonine-protein phosphatase 7 long form homolog [Gastrolobium bilobum]|uniref:serine/threonine-protein phosphatase 7 long form homolog n=1 Tax=Gastrolobium bilobum TaxID=150636 RepID=UPI002AB043F2|nr:serine/threonine-protein phosphatase 7 long form homolog [Gastrolobium bilobum]